MNDKRDSTVGEVIDGRRGVYGDPTVMFSRAAQIWSGITGYEINAVDVPLMLIGYKVLRTQHTPDYSDNSDDIEGYLEKLGEREKQKHPRLFNHGDLICQEVTPVEHRIVKMLDPKLDNEEGHFCQSDEHPENQPEDGDEDVTRDEYGSSISSIVECNHPAAQGIYCKNCRPELFQLTINAVDLPEGTGQRWVHSDGIVCIKDEYSMRTIVDVDNIGVIGGLCPHHD